MNGEKNKKTESFSMRCLRLGYKAYDFEED